MVLLACLVFGAIWWGLFWKTDPWGIFAPTKHREAEEREKRAIERCNRELKAMAEREREQS